MERAATDEPQSWVSVLGVDRHLTGWTSEDPLRAAVVGRCLDRPLVSRQQLHAVGLDQQVDDEGGTSLSLAVQAVTAVRKERFGRQR